MKKPLIDKEIIHSRSDLELDEVSVGFFTSCIVDIFRPSTGFASLRLLERAGCEVKVPELQTCCGQPTYNRGDSLGAMTVARQVISVFEQFDYVIVPSGSCAGMIREHYPRLFVTDLSWLDRARRLSEKTYELTQFLVDILKIEKVDAELNGVCVYHDSCSSQRELGIHQQPRKLLSNVKGLELKEIAAASECCGFGGLFCVTYPDISTHIVTNKAQNIVDTRASILVGGDLGCLFNIGGFLERSGKRFRILHVAEVLAGLTDDQADLQLEPLNAG